MIKETLEETKVQGDLSEFKETVSKQVSDIRDSFSREENVIIHGVTESNEKDSQKRKQSDTMLNHYPSLLRQIVRVL